MLYRFLQYNKVRKRFVKNNTCVLLLLRVSVKYFKKTTFHKYSDLLP